MKKKNLLKNDIKGLNIVILRCFNPIGMSEEYLKKSLIKNDTIIPTILNCIKENKPFNIYGNNFNTKDGTTIRDYIDINDVVDCIYKSYQNIQTKSNTYKACFIMGKTQYGTLPEVHKKHRIYSYYVDSILLIYKINSFFFYHNEKILIPFSQY